MAFFFHFGIVTYFFSFMKAPSTSDMDYLDMLNGMIDGPSTPAAKPTSAPKPAATTKDETDFLDMLDDMLGDTAPPGTNVLLFAIR